jgi:threonine dehydratase
MVDNIPILQQFYKYMTTMDGGSHIEDASRQNVQHVGRLIYQVVEKATNICVLWDDESLGKIRRQFFENNNTALKPRTATTLKAYITALRLFYQFLRSRKSVLEKKCGQSLSSDELTEIEQAYAFMQGWALSLGIAERKKEVWKRDLEE